eukprot:gnl/MRDRNA2_/MRDRNA2_24413_c0_seq1.p1 gnl/MRDRNA2_/MRDRNA2_24413_c0~~gnl/MRDRNA2_/MRDRNA2_24413_c0_seq1.p1  ORF type:complete len:498 (+),score=59.69 gnl/MRDRNA2_/MRDRNA2_24413_c0_seq1:216-1496(+)
MRPSPCEWSSDYGKCALSKAWVETLGLPTGLETVFLGLQQIQICTQISMHDICHKASGCRWSGARCEANIWGVFQQLFAEVFDVTKCGPMGLLIMNVAPCFAAEVTRAQCVDVGKQCHWSSRIKMECDSSISQCSDCDEGVEGCVIGDILLAMCPDADSNFNEIFSKCRTDANGDYESSDEYFKALNECFSETCKPLGEMMEYTLPRSMACAESRTPQECYNNVDAACTWNHDDSECIVDFSSMLPADCPYKALEGKTRTCTAKAFVEGAESCQQDPLCEWKVYRTCSRMYGTPSTSTACALDEEIMMNEMATAGDPTKLAALDFLRKEDAHCAAYKADSDCSAAVTKTAASDIENLIARMAEVTQREDKFKKNELGNEDILMEQPPTSNDSFKIRFLSVYTTLVCLLVGNLHMGNFYGEQRSQYK